MAADATAGGRAPARTPTGDLFLLTPGPLTTTPATKQAMLHDWGSRDPDFIALNRRVRERLVALAEAEGTHTAVLVQGSGTFAVEATIGTLLPRNGKALVVCNGAYGRRIVQMLKYLGRDHAVIDLDENVRPTPALVDEALTKDAAVTHVCIIHCETTTGILNPIEEIAAVVKQHGRRYIVDAMSSFGAIPISANTMYFDAVISSANKCIEGVPGVAFAIVRKEALEAAAGNAHSLALDLYDQWRYIESTGQWRFTPPVQVMAAFEEALKQHTAEGGVQGRGARYRANCTVIRDGLTSLGLQTYIPPEQQAPIILTFLSPRDPAYDFERLYNDVRDQGYVLYPGKLTKVSTFRVGCVGAIAPEQMKDAVRAIRETLVRHGVKDFAPASA